jgi:tetratricopeptide (TPR) repeat protein
MTPHLADALRALAHEELELGRARLEAIVDADPDDADAWAYLSGVLLAAAEAERATAASERALALDPDGFAPRMKAGELALRLGHLEEAESWFVAALRAVNPGTPAALAAKRALVVTRSRRRTAISHGARLPRLRLPFAWPRRRGITAEPGITTEAAR